MPENKTQRNKLMAFVMSSAFKRKVAVGFLILGLALVAHLYFKQRSAAQKTAEELFKSTMNDLLTRKDLKASPFINNVETEKASELKDTLDSVESLVAICLIAMGFTFLLPSAIRREDSFINIDEKRKNASAEALVLDLLKQELINVREEGGTEAAEKMLALLKDYEGQRNLEESKRLSSFAGYFHSIINVLQDKASISDEKASTLLDRGMLYTKVGIGFYILAIVAWQTLVAIKGFQNQYLYGIGSCSVLFIFIEFQSAWFLKQYRQFVDTSTYLIKVKAIFDRYLMLYLVATEAKPELKDASGESLKALLALLGADIKWPESYLMKDADANLAKEFVESLGGLIKVAKSKE